jgi:ABC-2 type transport system permease protein
MLRDLPRDTIIIARHTGVLLARDPGTLVAYAVMSTVLMLVLHPVYDVLAAPGTPGILGAATGTTIMFTLLALDVAGEQLLAERDWHTWGRLRATTTGPAAILIGKAVPLVGVFLAMQVLLFGEAAWWFGLDLSPGTWRLPVLAFVWACCVTALGLALGAWLRSRARMGAIADVGAMTMMGLSGALVPLSGLPGWCGHLAPVTPGYWAVRGFHAALLHRPADYARAIGVLAAVTVTAGALAALRTLARTRANRLGR